MKKEDYELLKRSEEIITLPFVRYLDSVLAKTAEGIDYINREYAEEISKIDVALKALANTDYNTDEYITKLSSLFVDFGRATSLYNDNIVLYKKWFSEYHSKTFANMEPERMNPVYSKLTKTMNDMYLGNIEPNEKLMNFVQETINIYRGYKLKADDCEKLLHEIDVEKDTDINETTEKAERVLSNLRYMLDENMLGDPKIKKVLGNSMNNLESHFDILKENRLQQSSALKTFVNKSQKDVAERSKVMKFMDQFQDQILDIKDREEEITLYKKK